MKTYISLCVLDNKENGAFNFGHFPVHAVETEAMLACAEDQGPEVTFRPGGQMPAEMFSVIVTEYFCGTN